MLPTSVTTNLETNLPPSQTITPTAVVLAASSTALNTDDQTATAQALKVRLSRVPKGVTPGVTPPPDPERWLKKSERSTFGQGRKRRGGGGGGTQGSTAEGAGATAASSHNVKPGKGKKKK
jgi:signal recognition particle subunit SRP72